MREEADCCQLATSISPIKYTELKNRGAGPGYLIHSNERRIKNIELSVRRCRRVSKRIMKNSGKS